MGCDQSTQNGVSGGLIQIPYRKPIVIFALGGPGSNKGLYCDLLVRDYKFKYLSVKDLVAFQSARDTAFSAEIKSCMNKGVLISSTTITKILKKAISNYGQRSFLVDGYPRNMQNIQSFESLLSQQVTFKSIIYFDCSNTLIESKIKSESKNISQANVDKVMKLYKSEVLPVVQHYSEKDMLVRINTELYPTLDANYEEVKAALRLFGVQPCEPQRILFMVSETADPERLGRIISRFFGFYLINVDTLVNRIKGDDPKQQTEKVTTALKIKLLRKELEKRTQMRTMIVQGYPMSLEQFTEWRRAMDTDTLIKGFIYHSQNQKKPDSSSQLASVLQQFQKRNQLFIVDSTRSPSKQLSLVSDKLTGMGIHPPAKRLKPKIFMVIGAPGSGKGFQCEKIRREFGFEYITTAQLLKREIADSRLHAELIESFINTGRLVPGEILIRLIKRYILEEKARNRSPFLLDGFPRNMSNMECWEDDIGDEVQLVAILHFECSQKVMEERLSNSKNAKSLAETPETISKRFNQYIKDTQPVIEQYKRLGLVISVNAEKSQDEVYSSVKQSLKDKGFRIHK